MGGWLDNLFNENKFVRRVIVAWAVWLITVAALEPEKYTDTKFLGIVGLLTIVIGFYQWSRGQED